MGSKNRLNLARKYKHLTNTTFHVTQHGIDDLRVFGRHREKRTFINCLQRHLSHERVVDQKRKPYTKHFDDVVLLAYCVMDNHYHLILHQIAPGGMAGLMHSALTGYAKYFNNQREREGSLFSGRYDARPILDHAHAKRAIAYVHLNHEAKLLDYDHQSHDYFVGRRRADWIDTDRGVAIFGGIKPYQRYLDRFGPDIIDLKRARRESTIFGPGI
jgi:REP element-mobilizing transposase RayT